MHSLINAATEIRVAAVSTCCLPGRALPSVRVGRPLSWLGELPVVWRGHLSPDVAKKRFEGALPSPVGEKCKCPGIDLCRVGKHSQCKGHEALTTTSLVAETYPSILCETIQVDPCHEFDNRGLQ